MTKKDRIIALAHEGKTVRQIAEVVYRLPKGAKQKEADRKMAYVRVVLRQRKDGPSKHDAAYIAANRDKICARKRRYYTRRYHSDAAWREQVLAAHKAWCQTKHGRAWRRAYYHDRHVASRSANHLA